MSYNTWTTNDLISDIQLLSHNPAGNNTFTPSQILRIAQFELQLSVTKQILATRGGYYMEYEDLPVVNSGLYSIPLNAIAGALANVELIQDPTIVPVNLIEESEQFSTISPTSTSYGFFLKGNYVQILPTPNIGTTRLWYFRRTSNLVLTSACAQVSQISGSVITVNSLPSTFATNTTLDCLGDQPPFNIFGQSLITNISGTDIQVDAVPAELSVGDWLGLAGQSCVPQIPVEYRLLLAQRTVCKIYELQGYLDKLKAAKAVLLDYEKDTAALITPRVQSQTKVISPVNGGFLAGSRRKLTNFPAGRTQ